MHRRITLVSVSCACISLLFAMSTLPVIGTPAYQLDPTDQQATIDAIVDERFTQTAIALTEAPPVPTTVSTVTPTPLPTLTLMPTALADGSQLFFAGSLNTVFAYAVDEDVFDEYEDGWEEYFARDYDDAIDAFSDAIDEDPDFAEAYYGRAISHLAEGDYEDALDDIVRFEMLTGRIDQDILISRIFAYANTDDDDALIQDAVQLLSTPPYDYFVVEVLMRAYLDAENYQDAIAVGDAMLPFFYAIPDFYDLRHDAYDEVDDDDNADFNDLIHDGLNAIDSGDLSEAEGDFEDAIELAQAENLSVTNLAVAYYNLGFVSIAQRDISDGLNALENAIQADPTFGAPYALTGILNDFTGEQDDAIDSFTAGINAAPDFVLNYIERAVVAQELDDSQAVIDDAIQWIERTQRHAILWDTSDLDTDSMLLPLFTGWSHRLVVELGADDELTIESQATEEEQDAGFVTSLIIILDPSGEPVASSVPRSSEPEVTELSRYDVTQSGAYTIIIANAGDRVGLVDVMVAID